MNNKEEIISNIKESIKRYGFTQSAIAQQMGISQASLTGIINGNPTLDKLIRIADILGCSVSELLGCNTSLPSNLKIQIDGKEYTYSINDKL